jgi:cell division septal protein FtsQ
MRAPTDNKATWNEHGKKLRRAANRKLRQRRAWRTRLAAPDWKKVGGLASGLARRAAPVLGLVTGLAFAAGAVLGVRYWVTTSPRFALHADAIHVVGNSRVTRDDVLLRAGLAEGMNVFAVALPEVEASLARDPWIEDVEVTRDLPHGLRVAVKERQASALLVADAPYLIDRTGRPFKRADLQRGEGDGLVVVTGVPRAAFARDAESAAAIVREALAVATAYHAEKRRPPVGEVNVSRAGFTLYTLEGAVALRLGRARGADLAARLRRFDATWMALSDAERAVAKTIWLDSATRGDRVTVQLADAR